LDLVSNTLSQNSIGPQEVARLSAGKRQGLRQYIKLFVIWAGNEIKKRFLLMTARKIIIMDMSSGPNEMELRGLSAIIISLSLGYYLIKRSGSAEK
jgi:hypothetical protein